jgi:phage terminase large subunit
VLPERKVKQLATKVADDMLQKIATTEVKRKRGRPKKGEGKNPKTAAGCKMPPIKSNTLSVQDNTTSVFWRTVQHANAPIIVERGGARSSKSYSVSQLLGGRFLSMCDVGRRILVMRKTFPALRISIRPMIYGILQRWGMWDKIREDKQGNDLIFGNSLMHFGSLDKPEKIRSSEWNDILLEEANEFTYDDYMNVGLRMSAPDHGVMNQMYILLNPTDSFSWIKTKLIGEDPLHPLTEGVVEIHSTYRDNQFLPLSYIQKLEAVKDQDPNYWKVFGEGEWGKLDNLVFKWWTTVTDVPANATEIYYGLDFGFVNPSCLLEFRQDGKEIYVIERIYQEGLTNTDLIERMKRIIPEPVRNNAPIYPDVAEPARIKELEEAGFWVVPSDKDVLDGIDAVKQFHLNIVDGVSESSPYASPNVLKEIRAYSYKTNKEGRVLEEPVKFNDHAMAAIRYGVHTHNKLRYTINVRELDDYKPDRKKDPFDPWAGFEDM